MVSITAILAFLLLGFVEILRDIWLFDKGRSAIVKLREGTLPGALETASRELASNLKAKRTGRGFFGTIRLYSFCRYIHLDGGGTVMLVVVGRKPMHLLCINVSRGALATVRAIEGALVDLIDPAWAPPP